MQLAPPPPYPGRSTSPQERFTLSWSRLRSIGGSDGEENYKPSPGKRKKKSRLRAKVRNKEDRPDGAESGGAHSPRPPLLPGLATGKVEG